MYFVDLFQPFLAFDACDLGSSSPADSWASVTALIAFWIKVGNVFVWDDVTVKLIICIQYLLGKAFPRHGRGGKT